MSALIILDVFFVFFALCLTKKIIQTHSSLHALPPGPKGLPLIGNLFDLPDPARKAWLDWWKLKKLYGPLSSVTVFGQTIVVLNDYNTAVALLERNSAVYSNRPEFTFGGEMIGYTNSVPFLQYGDRFKQQRRNLHQFMGTRAAVTKFSSPIDVENRRFLSRTLRDPTKLRDHIRRISGAIILRLTYGYNIEPEGPDQLVDLADKAMAEFILSTAPGTWTVDVLPILRYLPEWLPGMSFKRTAREWRRNMIEFVDRPYQFVKQALDTGDAPSSYVSMLFSSSSTPPTAEDESCFKWGAVSVYGGGADTTVSALSTFFLAMVLHPDVQHAAQREIDRVVGTDRLPTAEDRSRLPYVEAVFKECLRWSVVVPMGLPHASSEEYVYQGYRIPKDAIVMANIWGFSHDSDTYTSPDEFSPARFLGNIPEMDPKLFVFGFGRRICPGKELADASMWLTIANSLAVFNIEKARDETGKEITPPAEYDNGFICHPKDFPCSIVPRSSQSEALVRSVDYEHPYEKSDADALNKVKWGDNFI